MRASAAARSSATAAATNGTVKLPRLSDKVPAKAWISTYGRMLDTQLSRAHLRRRRRSGIGRLTDPTAVAQLWLRAGSSCPIAAIALAERVRLSWVESCHGTARLESKLRIEAE